MKNKQFKKWALKHHNVPKGNEELFWLYWDKLTQAMQWGVYLEFFDKVGIIIDVSMNYDSGLFDIVIDEEFIDTEIICNSRPEAQQEAVKKAFEILEK